MNSSLIAAKTGLSQTDSGRALNAVTETITEALRKGGSVPLIGFGTFEVRDRSARTGRNPKTGEELKIKAAKVPAFKAGTARAPKEEQKNLFFSDRLCSSSSFFSL
jgi:DNA-binding protein HU-beta